MVQLETYVPGTRHFFSFLFGLGLGFKVRYGSTILPKGAGPSIPNADDVVTLQYSWPISLKSSPCSPNRLEKASP